PSPRPSAGPSAGWRWRSCAPSRGSPVPCGWWPGPKAWSRRRSSFGSATVASPGRFARARPGRHPPRERLWRECRSRASAVAARCRHAPYPLRPAATQGSDIPPPHRRLRAPFDGDPMNKRNAFHVLAAAVLAAASTALAAPPPQALKDAYADAFLVGTAMNADMVSGKDARAQALVPLHFNAITAEHAMKAEELHPEPGTWDFADADAFVEFGQRHGLFMVGHTLVWHNQTPAWFFQDDDGAPAGPAVMRERMRDYIHTVAGRYAGKVQAWDVVNEQI